MAAYQRRSRVRRSTPRGTLASMAHRTAALPDGPPSRWPAVEVALDHPRWWRRPSTRWCLVAMLLCGAGALLGVEHGWLDGAGVAALLGGTWALCVAAVVRAWLACSRAPAAITFGADRVFVPRWSTDDHVRVVRADEVRDVAVVERAGGAVELRLSTERRVVRVRAGQLDVTRAQYAAACVAGMVAQAAGGAARLAGLARRAESSAVMGSRGAWAVGLVTAVCVAVHAALVASESGGKALGALVFGAHARALLWEGQWFRFFTGNFVHREAWHLWGNLVVLVPLGAFLERALGTGRMLLLVGTAGAASAVASNSGAHAASMGISGLVFAVVGASVVLLVRHRDVLPGPVGVHARAMALGVVVVMGAEAVGGAGAQGVRIDHGAHIAGLLVGTLFGLALRARHVGTREPLALPWRAWNGLFLGVHAAAALACAMDTTPLPALARRCVMGAVDPDTQVPEELNQAAWFTALDPAAPAEELVRAETMARRLVARSPQASHLDTLATVLARRGALDEALQLQWRSYVPVTPARGFYASQLARLGEKSRARGDLRVLDERVRMVPRVQPADDDEPGLHVEVMGLPDDGTPRVVVGVLSGRLPPLVVTACVDGPTLVPVLLPQARSMLTGRDGADIPEPDVVLVLTPEGGVADACAAGVLAYPRDPATRDIP